MWRAVLIVAVVLGLATIVGGLALRMFGEAVGLVMRSGANLEVPFDTSVNGWWLVIGGILAGSGASGLVLASCTASTRGHDEAVADHSLNAWVMAEERFLAQAGAAAGRSPGRPLAGCTEVRERAQKALAAIMGLLAELESPEVLEAFGRWSVARRALDDYLDSGETGEGFVNVLNATIAALEDIRRSTSRSY